MSEINVKRLFRNKLKRMSNDVSVFRSREDIKICCPVCGEELKEDKLNGVEYVKTKRGTEIFIHTDCVGRWSKC